MLSLRYLQTHFVRASSAYVCCLCFEGVNDHRGNVALRIDLCDSNESSCVRLALHWLKQIPSDRKNTSNKVWIVAEVLAVDRALYNGESSFRNLTNGTGHNEIAMGERIRSVVRCTRNEDRIGDF